MSFFWANPCRLMSHGLTLHPGDTGSGHVGTKVKQGNQMMNFDDRTTEHRGIAYRSPGKSPPPKVVNFF